ncbi:protein FAR1-RELATED SEQUENCE 5-like [Silene latifolia]|uniref:protein FAR1-RELATED SEQUENCE 5-like n=1 Tax=Silene latifolia TaxID=37657 RepID=UPI003D77BE3A
MDETICAVEEQQSIAPDQSMVMKEVENEFEDDACGSVKAFYRLKGVSTNNALGFQANESTSLTQFYRLFKHTITRWRKKELKLEFYCSKSKPHYDFALSGLLKHALEVCTSTLFCDFEEEFKVGIGTFARKICEDETQMSYKVAIDENFISSEVVTYGFVNNPVLVSCSCKNFEECA